MHIINETIIAPQITVSAKLQVLILIDVLILSQHAQTTGTPDKSGPMALNQFRPSVPVWSETLWQTFVKHVAKIHIADITDIYFLLLQRV
jgi:hypothetical protein